MKTYEIGQIIEHNGLHAHVYAIGEIMTSTLGSYRMIGIEYFTGLRSAIKIDIESTPAMTTEEMLGIIGDLSKRIAYLEQRNIEIAAECRTAWEATRNFDQLRAETRCFVDAIRPMILTDSEWDEKLKTVEAALRNDQNLLGIPY